MTSRTLRRRLHHHDVDGRRNEQLTLARSDSLNEPLLGNHDYRNKNAEVYASSRDTDLWDDDEKKEKLHWTFLFSQLIAQWAQWIGSPFYSAPINANIIVSSSSFLGKLMTLPSNVHYGQDSRNSSFVLSPLQEERLGNLKHRLEVPYDGSWADHQDALRELWRLAYPGREIPPLKSELWKEMGWQGTDPSTDFRGGGFISLENLIFFAKHFPEAFQRLLHKQEGRRSEWEYPFAVAGINVSFMLAQMLDLQSAKPTTLAGVRFLQLLALDEMAFDKLYCVAFWLMDAQWLAKHASYMEFNDVLKSTRTQLERELALEDVSSVKDLPAFNMLNP